MFDTLTTEEKVLGGGVLLGLGLLAFVKPARNAVGLADREQSRKRGERKYFLEMYDDKGTYFFQNFKRLDKKQARKRKIRHDADLDNKDVKLRRKKIF
jgi:hypothetical protein